MSNPSLQMLFERLLWPVPRVRWETMRAIAALIRDGDSEAALGLLGWVSQRTLESEAALGLTVIDAFNLGRCFKFDQVASALRAPSHLADWMLKKNFEDHANLFAFRYSYAPDAPAVLAHDQALWFQRYLRWAVPPIFSMTMLRLENSSGRPFAERWEHEWQWLQATHPRAPAEYPRYFSGSDPGWRGQFDHGQRELYISAFLRTLAFAAAHWGMPHSAAEHYALLGLYLNRGIAELEPISPPAWAGNLLSGRSKSSTRALRLRRAAQASLAPEESLIAVTAVELTELGFVKFELVLVVGPAGFSSAPAEAGEFGTILTLERRGEMGGLVAERAKGRRVLVQEPMVLAQSVMPADVGRGHTDMVSSIHLASPYVFGQAGYVICDGSDVRLLTEAGEFSRWTYWYAGWEPTMPEELNSSVCFLATAQKRELRGLCRSEGFETAWLVRVQRVFRERSYSDPEIGAEAFWIPSVRRRRSGHS